MNISSGQSLNSNMCLIGQISWHLAFVGLQIFVVGPGFDSIPPIFSKINRVSRDNQRMKKIIDLKKRKGKLRLLFFWYQLCFWLRDVGFFCYFDEKCYTSQDNEGL